MAYIIVDTETTGLDIYADGFRCTAIGFYVPAKDRFGFIAMSDPLALDKLELFQHLLDTHTAVFYNAKYDVAVLERSGLQVTSFHDAQVLGMLMGNASGERKLKDNAVRYFGKDSIKYSVEAKSHLKQVNKQRKKEKLPALVQGDLEPELLKLYCLEDVKNTARLFFMWASGLSRQPDKLKLYQEELAVIRPIIEMERLGMRVDLERLAKVRKTLVNHRTDMEALVYKEAGGPFRITNNEQLVLRLYPGGLSEVKVWTKKTHKPATNEEALKRLKTPLARALLAYRKSVKALRYAADFLKYSVVKYTDDGSEHRIHPNFNPNGARTSRFSCSRPNLQNVPRADVNSLLGELRSIFLPSEGACYLLHDYSQIELRIGAMYAEDETMLGILERGGDIHAATTKAVFGVVRGDPDFEKMRHAGKTLNFTMYYGAGPATVARQAYKTAGLDVSVAEARLWVEAYKAKFRGIPKLFERVIKEVRSTGGVTSIYGRFYPVDQDKAYSGVNYLIQGTCADILKGAIRRCTELLRPYRTRLVSCIHDELIFETYGGEEKLAVALKSAMEAVPLVTVPIVVDMSTAPLRWSVKHKLMV